MSDTSIDNLLSMLNEVTEECNDLVVLKEDSGEFFDHIQKRLFGMQNVMMNSLKNKHPAYMTQDTTDLIKRVREIKEI